MCKFISPFYVIVGLIMLASCSAETNIHDKETQATALLTEDNITPLNVHNPSPRLSWLANVDSQSHYQIQVASSLSKLEQEQADLWDSGKVTSNISRNVSYKGKALSTNDKAFWRLRVWKKGEDTPTTWSEPTFWQMGLLHQSDWQAKWIKVSTPTTANLTSNINQWISHAGTVETPKGTIEKPTIDKLEKMPSASLFRQQFSVNKKLISATLHSTAGGYYEVYINGQKVNNRIMDPGQTDFDQRIMYNSDDVAPFLQQGENAIAVHLGSGWYNEEIAFSKWKDPDGKYSNKADRSYSFGQPKFIAQYLFLVVQYIFVSYDQN